MRSRGGGALSLTPTLLSLAHTLLSLAHTLLSLAHTLLSLAHRWYVPTISAYRTQAQKSRGEKALQALARTRLGGWLFVHVFPAVDRWLIPRTRGRLKVAVGQPILLLHTRGAKSGQPRSTPLLYTPHDHGFVVVASKAGAPQHPAWYHNLRAHPDEVAVEVGGRQIPVHPRVADEPERSELWKLVNDNYNGYTTYQQRAGHRVVPVVVLEPVG
jgi:deazaflavin-dependent oxidoreductase (nitroreductase family)